MNIKEVREKFPQYTDLSDEQLADALHQKFYSDMPKDQFLSKIGIAQPSTMEKVGANARALWEGVRGPVRLAQQVIGKADIPYLSEAMRADVQDSEDALRRAKQVAPVGAAVSQTVGSIISPPSIAAMGAFPAAAGAAPSVLRSAAQGAGQGGLFGLMQPVQNVDNMLGEKLDQVNYGMIGGAAGGAAGGVGQKAVAARAAAKAARATQDAAAVGARQSGYTLPPSTTNPSMTNSVIEGLSGKIKTAQQASIRNQAVTNALVRKALGMADDAPITKESLEALRKNAGAAYEAVKGVPQPFAADQPFRSMVSAMRTKAEQTAKAFPSLANQEASKILDDLAADTFDPAALVEATKQLRSASSKVLNSPLAAPKDIQVARVQKQAAQALEDLVARNLKGAGLDDLHSAWQAARREIAKIKNVEKALNDSTGNVVAKRLSQQMAKGSPLTGELETVARSASAFPKAMQEVTESMPALSPLDFAAALFGSAGTGNLVGASGLLARPVARSVILSRPYQALMGNPSYGPGMAGLLGSARPAIPGAAASLLLAD